MKKQLAIGFVMSLALTQMTFAGPMKPMETRKTETKETAKSIEAAQVLSKSEKIAKKAEYLVSMSEGKADLTRLAAVLNRDTIVVVQEGGKRKNYSMMETADLMMKADQELKAVNKNTLSAQGRAVHEARQAALEIAPDFIASGARRSDFKTELPPLTKKEVELFDQQLSLLVDIVSNPKWSAEDINSHVKVMKAATDLVKVSTTLTGDQAFSIAAGGGKRLSQKELDEKLPCGR